MNHSVNLLITWLNKEFKNTEYPVITTFPHWAGVSIYGNEKVHCLKYDISDLIKIKKLKYFEPSNLHCIYIGDNYIAATLYSLDPKGYPNTKVYNVEDFTFDELMWDTCID